MQSVLKQPRETSAIKNQTAWDYCVFGVHGELVAVPSVMGKGYSSHSIKQGT